MTSVHTADSQDIPLYAIQTIIFAAIFYFLVGLAPGAVYFFTFVILNVRVLTSQLLVRDLYDIPCDECTVPYDRHLVAQRQSTASGLCVAD